MSSNFPGEINHLPSHGLLVVWEKTLNISYRSEDAMENTNQALKLMPKLRIDLNFAEKNIKAWNMNTVRCNRIDKVSTVSHHAMKQRKMGESGGCNNCVQTIYCQGVCKGNKPLFLESLLRGGMGDVQLIFLSKLLLGHSYITIYTNWAYNFLHFFQIEIRTTQCNMCVPYWLSKKESIDNLDKFKGFVCNIISSSFSDLDFPNLSIAQSSCATFLLCIHLNSS